MAYEADTAVSGILFLLSGWYDCIYHAVCDSVGLYDACRVPAVWCSNRLFPAGLLFVLALFATAFALFLNMLFAQKVTANMLGSALAVLASIISGGFYEVAHEGGILDTIASMLMTKAVLQLSESLEAGLTAQAVEHLGFVLLWASALFIATLLVQWMHKTAAD